MIFNDQKSFIEVPLHETKVFSFTSMLRENELNSQVCSKHFANFLEGVEHAQKNWTKFMSILDSSKNPFVRGESVLKENELNSWVYSSD